MNVVNLDQAAQLLKSGKIGVIPTDTVYGLVALAANELAVARIYKVKNRVNKPGPTIAASVDQLRDLGLLESDLIKAAKFWPNPISIVLKPGANLAYLSQGLPDLPFRVVANTKTSEFLQKTGALATTSANAPGEPAAENLQQAVDYFGDAVDFYVDGGEISNALPSTIIGFDGENVKIYREGAVTKQKIESLKNANS
ncbi:MAG TPA: L-threonylcarbamoyladenylate synthase [Candidatus Saccharimonadales bacterium]|nr:L-threonylcarbamoyladenylate synthase [Candidatus Saccharimonadales bacterium]